MKAGVVICVLCLATLTVAAPGRGESPATGSPVATTGIAQAGDWFALLHGVVDPNGIETRAWFEWGKTPAFGFSTPAQVVPAGGQASLAERIETLESFTTYYFRIVAENASGTAVGETVRFGTLDTVPPPPQLCRVPKVVGKRLLAARRSVTNAGCRVGRPVRYVRSRRKQGIVVSQSPKGGTSRHFNAAVRLVVSRGPR